MLPRRRSTSPLSSSVTAQADDPPFYLGCSRCSHQGCVTLHEHDGIEVDWTEHAQAGADMVPQPSPSPGRWGAAEVVVHPPGTIGLFLFTKGPRSWQIGMLLECLLDQHQLLSPATTCFQQKTSRCLWNSPGPASETAVTAKRDIWGSTFWIYTDRSWIPLTPSASAQPSVKGWMGVKIPPFENCHPSRSWSVFGDLEQ